MPTIPTRIEGPEPPARTPPTRDEVRAWLVAAERGDAEHVRQRSEPSPGMHAVSRWPAIYIKDYVTRQYLKAYIWCDAHGHSFEKLCKERDGWSVRTGRRKAAEALDLITALLAFEIADKGAGALVTAETLQPNALTMRPYSTLPVARIGPDATCAQTK